MIIVSSTSRLVDDKNKNISVGSTKHWKLLRKTTQNIDKDKVLENMTMQLIDDGNSVLIEMDNGTKESTLFHLKNIHAHDVNKQKMEQLENVIWINISYLAIQSRTYQLSSTIADLYSRGIDIDWNAYHNDSLVDLARNVYTKFKVALPTYPFQRRRFWFSPEKKNKLAIERQTKTKKKREKIERDVKDKDEGNLEFEQRKDIEDSKQIETLLWNIKWVESEALSSPQKTQKLKQKRKLVVLICSKEEKHTHNILKELDVVDHVEYYTILKGDKYEHLGGRSYSIRHNKAEEDISKVFTNSSISIELSQECTDIVNMWTLESANKTKIEIDDIANITKELSQDILAIVHAITKHKWSQDTPRLWSITSNVNTIEHEHITTLEGINQAVIWGVNKTLWSEFPDLNSTCIDIDYESNQWEHSVMHEIVYNQEQSIQREVILTKQNRRLIPQLVPIVSTLNETQESAKNAFDTVKKDAVVLTGGTGGLGLHLLKVLTAYEARHIVLLSRSKPNGRGLKTIEKLQCRFPNTRIYVFQTDVANSVELFKTLDMIQESIAPIAVIVHAAGVIQDALVLEQSWETFERVLMPKVQGSWNLHQWSTRHQSTLKFFVLYSSIASLFGSMGQSNYSGANAFMDALSRYRRNIDIPCVSVNWGLWSGQGMASSIKGLEQNLKKSLKVQGVGIIQPKWGKIAMMDAVAKWATTSQIAVVPINAKKWNNMPNQAIPIMGLEFTTTNGKMINERQKRTKLDIKTSGKSKQEQKNTIASILNIALRNILTLSHDPDISTPLREIGLDSIGSLEIRNILSNVIGDVLPATFVYNYPTVTDMVEIIWKKYCDSKQYPQKDKKNYTLRDKKEKKVEKNKGNSRSKKNNNNIAIIGISARYPRDIITYKEFWQVLERGLDEVTEVPLERWDITKYYDNDITKVNKMNTRCGGFLKDISMFDASFFGISPKEALFMDPQQRILLELGWSALEDASYPPTELKETQTGIFIGMTSGEYHILQSQSMKEEP